MPSPSEIHNQASGKIIDILIQHKEEVKEIERFLVLVESTICACLFLITKDFHEQLKILEDIIIPNLEIRLNELKQKQN